MITAILLAAGASQRMGAPKALLRISGTSFIRHIIDALGASRVSSTIVVLGADAEVIKTEIAGAKVHVVVNEDFASKTEFGQRLVRRPWQSAGRSASLRRRGPDDHCRTSGKENNACANSLLQQPF